MASISENTHAKNLENVHIANTIVASIGGIFKPNNPAIQSAALTAFETTFSGNMQTVNQVLTAEKNTVGDQLAAFGLVSKRVTKIMKAVKGLGLAPEFIESLQSTVNRLNGVRVSSKTPDTPPVEGVAAKKNVSVSRRSYAGILESLDLLDEQLQSNASYAPNEDEFKTAAISGWVDGLKTIHNSALEAKTATRAVRTARDAHAYNATDGIIPRMKALKAYAETILDASDTRLKQLKKLKFADYSK
jgi:hypothetical protein